MRPAPRVSFPQPFAARFSPKSSTTSGAIGTTCASSSASTASDATRTTSMILPRPARHAPRAFRRHARPRPQRVARRSGRLRFPDLSHGPQCAACKKRRRNGGLGRNVDGRAPRHHRRRATEHADRAARRQRRRAHDRTRRAGADPRIFRRRSHIRDVRRNRAVRPHGFRTLRYAQRRSVGAPHSSPTFVNAPTGAGGSRTIPASRCRFGRRPRRRICGRCGMRSIARRLSCTAAIQTCSRRKTAAEMAARGPKPTVLDFAGVGHAPMLLSPDQIDPVVRFLRCLTRRLFPWPGNCFRWPGRCGHNPLPSLTIVSVTVPRPPCRLPSACRPSIRGRPIRRKFVPPR